MSRYQSNVWYSWNATIPEARAGISPVTVDTLVKCRLRVVGGWHEETHPAGEWHWRIEDAEYDVVEFMVME